MTAVVFYATREGHTRRIAEHIAAEMRARRADVDIFDVNALPSSIDWSRYLVACVAASVHRGHHEREMLAFVRQYRDDLTRLGAFFCRSRCPRPAPRIRSSHPSVARRPLPTRSG